MKVGADRIQRGFFLLEVILALTVFAMAVTGFVVALRQMSLASMKAHDKLRVTRILQTAMNETLSLPVLEPGEMSYTVDEGDIEIHALIEPLEDLENEDGETLQEMFRIRITARWYEEGDWESRVAETWRYARMYQP